MGLGKTIATLTALDILRGTFEVGNILVVAPLRVARKVWTDEIRKWDHVRHLHVEKIIGTAEQRTAAMNAPADIHTVNFENLVWLINHYKEKGSTRLKQPWPWDTVVLDEASGFKSKHTQRWKALKRVIRETERFIELTGTPAPNGLVDVWAPVYFLDFGARLGKTLTAYRNRWFAPPGYGRFRWEPFDHSEEQIHDRLKGIALAMRAEDYLDLPPVMPLTVRVEMPDEQRRQYAKMERKFFIELGGKQITAVNRGVLWGKLLQLANGALYTDSKGAWLPFHDAKLEALQELVGASLDTGHPVMIIHNFRSDIERISTLLKRMKVKHRTLVTENDENAWNAGKIEALSLHPASAGHGLNLHDGGETIIWYGLNPSLELYEQANGRLAGGLRRIGKNVRIHHLVTDNTVDEDVMEMLASKDKTQERLFTALKRRIGAL